MILFALLACVPQPKDTASTDSGIDLIDRDGDGHDYPDDCDDHNPAVFPGAEDTWYDGLDADCMGNDDYDADGDGVDAAPAGGDCDDADPTVYPGRPERCDGRDEDCDAVVDDDPVEGVTVYTDGDADGYGGAAIPVRRCVLEAGESLVGGDCDDTNGEIHPSAAEVCDDTDNDCDGYADNAAVDAALWLPDIDGDTYGDDAQVTAACVAPAGYTDLGGDCDDGDASVFPGASETCDDRDEDCDGTADEDATNPHPFLPDVDGDEYGDDTQAVVIACDAPEGYVERPGDCDDTNAAVSPRAAEVCDGIDNDCDDGVDADATDATAVYPDLDGDGWGGDAGVLLTCDPLDAWLASGWLETGGDCDDAHAEANPLGVEVCDGLDDDCDGVTDPDGAPGTQRWYADLDGDHAAGPDVHVDSCAAPAGYLAVAEDCDDAEPRANPTNREDCTTPFDDDCDGEINEGSAFNASLYAPDADGDGYGEAATGAPVCTPPEGSVANGDDCDDTDATVSPAAAEVDDDRDQDCDGRVDEDFVPDGALVITELARDPWEGGDGLGPNPAARWFEVTNTSDRTLHLDGWRVADGDGASFEVAPGAVDIAPGDYVVFCGADATFSLAGDCSYDWTDPTWGVGAYTDVYTVDAADGALTISLEDRTIDSVTWSSAEGWASAARATLALDATTTSAAGNDDAASWCLGTAVYTEDETTGEEWGTPGSENGICAGG